jgi:hypothetical protein
LKVSTPMSIRPSSCLAYHLQASGLVKSTYAIPGCQRSHLGTEDRGSSIAHVGKGGEIESSLPDIPVGPLDKVALLYSLFEEMRTLGCMLLGQQCHP